MIPKVIHYCWFGKNPLPASAQKCIASWRKYLPDYEIKEWNEDNFEVNAVPYTQQSYEVRKYAFVSDYARFWILYHFGGLYFDTDVEVIKPLDDIIKRGAFMGIEQGAFMDGKPMVAPGLGMGIEAGHPFYERMLQVYEQLEYRCSDGSFDNTTIVSYTTRELYEHGMISSDDLQEVDGIWIYPADYFCPMDSTTGITSITERTVSIHHYDCSWMNHLSFSFKLHQMKNFFFRLIGQKYARLINHICH